VLRFDNRDIGLSQGFDTPGVPNLVPGPVMRYLRCACRCARPPLAPVVAPMMDWTDRHCRFFHRLITRHTRLYTEMVTTGALLHGDVPRHLDFDAAEHPVALQLGGSEPADLAQAARLARALGLRRDQPQLRLPQRTGAARRLRRLPDGRAGAGGDGVAAMRDAWATTCR
jgi:tRNA-dihydrouridine synthase A